MRTGRPWSFDGESPLDEDDVNWTGDNRVFLILLVKIRDHLHFETDPFPVIFRIPQLSESVKTQEKPERLVASPKQPRERGCLHCGKSELRWS